MDGRGFVKKSMEIHGGTQAEFAEACGVSQGLISQFLSGAKKPGWKTCKKIELLTHGQVTRYQLRPDIFGDQHPGG
jgi:DNA-binding transcriptional regulator YdaS (Cro superfamily)